MYKRIIIFFTVFAIAFSLFCSPVSASDYQSSATSLWDYFLHSLCKATEDAPFLSEIFDLCGYAFTDSVCNLSDDHFHHADSIANCEMGSDEYGSYALATCKYCYTEFKYYSSDLKRAYGQPAGHGLGGQSGGTTGGFGYVKKVEDELGATIVGPSGFQIPFPLLLVCRVGKSSSCASPSSSFGYSFDVTIDASKSSFLLRIDTGDVKIPAPVDGYYSVCGELNLYNCSIDPDYLPKSHLPCSKGTLLTAQLLCLEDSSNHGSRYAFRLNPIDPLDFCHVSGRLYLSCEPFQYSLNSFTDSIGGTSTRMSGLLSDMAGTLFGTMNDAGELVVSAAKSIFSEADNTYTNPATGASANVTDWTYDYSDRSYHLTTEEGDTVTVTYGDENITIQEGDTTYNVYYVIDSSAGSDPCPEGGDHDWQLGETAPATCVTAGSETRTCSKCGEERTTQLPALGHKWKVKQTSQTKYDEAGELIQQGFTVYECERCGEQYKQTDETGPPGVVPGGGGGGSSGGDGGDGDSIWDSIVDFFKSIAASFASLPDWFSRFNEFLSSAFSYLPDEIVLLLTFGVFAVVGIGIWKAVRR